jgi:hypothetical protein
MKALLLALALALTCLCPVQTCEAITSNILGRWSAKLTTFYQGKKTPATGSTTVRRFETQGIYMSGTAKVPGQSLGKSQIWLYDSGEVYGEISQSGIVIGTVTGTWSEAGNRLQLSTSVSTLYADYTQDTTYVLKGRKKIDTSTRTSFGMRGAGVMIRK